jgi:MFS family permease
VRLRQAHLVAYISTVHGLVHTIEFTYAALLSRIDNEFGAGLFVLGIVANAFAFTFGFSALPSGLLVDRLGTQRVLLIAFSLAAVAALLVATSPNPAVLGLFLALLGLSIGLYHPAGISFIAQATERRQVALGWHGVVGNLGIAIAPVLAIGIAEALDWRWAYVLLAALAVIAAVSVRIVRLDGHAEVEAEDLPPDAEVREDSFATDDVPPPVASAGWRAFVPLFLVYGVFVLNGFVYRGSLTFLPTHIEDNLNISWFGLEEAALASSLTTLALLAGSAGQLFGGTLSQRQTLERLAVPMTLALLPSLLLIGVTSGLWMVVFAGAFVFANFSAQPVYTGLIADYSPQQALGRSYGVSFFAAFGIGSLAATFAGFFADRWGTDSVFVVLAGVAGITLLLAVAIWRLAERARAEGQLAAQLR